MNKLVALVAALLFCSATLLAQKPQVLPQHVPARITLMPPPPAPQVTPQLTPEDLAAFFDGFIPIELQRDDIAGAVVVVVKDGNVLFAKGYGYSDVKSRKPVTVNDTLFRPGSISKTFTWTAVMQLVEQGKIDLDRDVNAYLDFRIPDAFGKPVTMRNLLTHSGGFEDVDKGLIVFDPQRDVSLRQSLVANMPARLYPPGTVPAYSNWGAGLAGYIVQRVSGEAFPDYIAHHILAPLGMAHASFQQPLPPALAADMTKGYGAASGAAKPFEYVPAAPAGALAASGDDIGRWMIAQLQDGQLDGQRILQAKTAETMHSPQFRPVPGVEAMDF